VVNSVAVTVLLLTSFLHRC